nr:MAG TPA: hypothetical protein [Caudoviricetes sp.]
MILEQVFKDLLEQQREHSGNLSLTLQPLQRDLLQESRRDKVQKKLRSCELDQGDRGSGV